MVKQGPEGFRVALLRRCHEAFDRPDWLGEEVTGHVRYYNFRLAAAPFGHWPDADRQAARAGRHRESAVGEGS